MNSINMHVFPDADEATGHRLQERARHGCEPRNANGSALNAQYGLRVGEAIMRAKTDWAVNAEVTQHLLV